MDAGPHQTYLEALEEKARLKPNQPLLWIPHNAEPGKPVSEWKPITSAQFHAEVAVAKQFYDSKGKKLSIPKGSVVGVWLGGNKYTDCIQTLGVAAAGFVPQLFSLYFSHSPVVFELLKKSEAKALVVDTRLPGMPDLSGCPVAAVDIATDAAGLTSEISSPSLAPRPYAEVKDDTALMFHSSGSTAKIPKLIPRTHSAIASLQAKIKFTNVAVQWGNFSYAATNGQLLSCFYHDGSLLIPSSLGFSAEELLNMIQSCGLTMLYQFTPMLTRLLEKARSDTDVLSALRSLSEIRCVGVDFPADLAAWCQSVGLPIANIYALSECGPLMVSSPFGNASLLKPLPDLKYKMMPFERDGEELLEFALLADSPCLPHSSLLAPDGDYHTGDLFKPAEDGYYLYRGRKNDWIKTGLGQICDTKSIDDAVKQLCQDIVFDCVAVGSGRPSPALLVEPTEHAERDTIPRIIVERLATFNENRFPHERLDDPRLVLVVDRGALPRTAVKGNIRRQGSEELFSNELNVMYKVLGTFKGVY